MNTWQHQESKIHFSDVIRQAVNAAPPSLTELENNLVDFIQNSPLKGLSLDLGRSPSQTRDIVHCNLTK